MRFQNANVAAGQRNGRRVEVAPDRHHDDSCGRAWRLSIVRSNHSDRVFGRTVTVHRSAQTDDAGSFVDCKIAWCSVVAYHVVFQLLEFVLKASAFIIGNRSSHTGYYTIKMINTDCNLINSHSPQYRHQRLKPESRVDQFLHRLAF